MASRAADRVRAGSGADVTLELDSAQGLQMEVAGFVGWLVTDVALIVYLLWAFVPDSVWHSIGVYYYPDRYLAVAVPAWAVVTFLCFSLFTAAAHLQQTAPHESYASVYDTASNDLPDKTDWASATVRGTPEIGDYPITLVNQLLFGQRHRLKDEQQDEPPAPADEAARKQELRSRLTALRAGQVHDLDTEAPPDSSLALQASLEVNTADEGRLVSPARHGSLPHQQEHDERPPESVGPSIGWHG